MSLACPVCGEPQADAEHLANHLAFSAMLGRDDHEAWLDEHAPDWAGMGPDDLAPVVADHAPEADLPAGGADHDHDERRDASRTDDRGGRFEDALADHGGYGRDAGLDAETERVLSEARELTAEMYGVEDEGDGDEGDGDEGGDGDEDG